EAQTVAKKANDGCSCGRRDAWKRAADRKAKHKIDGTRDETLQLDNLQGIGERHLSGKVVVKSPGDTCARDGQRSREAAKGRRSDPGYGHRASHDAGHAERDPHVEILAEDEPRYQAGLVNNLNLA